MDIGEGIANGANILLLLQQNRIFQTQNLIMHAQLEHDTGRSLQPPSDRRERAREWLRTYWPSLLIVLIIAGMWVVPRVSRAGLLKANQGKTATTSPLQQFLEGGNRWNLLNADLSNLDQGDTKHCRVNVVASEQGYTVAEHLIGAIQNMCDLIPHGSAGSQEWIGRPADYNLEDGITIRAHANSAVATALRLSLKDALGIDISYRRLADSDNRPYDALLEIGNFRGLDGNSN